MRKLHSLLYIAALLVASTFAAVAGPKLVIEGGSTYDWGTVSKQDSPLKAEITLKNEGDEELKITKVKPACGCTTKDLAKDVLAPGESTTLKLELRVSKGGRVSKSVTIMSNDSEKPTKLLYLKADVFEPLKVSRSAIAFSSKMKVGEEMKSNFEIKNVTDRAITLSNFKAGTGLEIDKKGSITLQPGEKIVVNVIGVAKKVGQFSSQIVVSTDHPDQPEITVRTYGRARDAVESATE